jgi:hypothetical protein
MRFERAALSPKHDYLIGVADGTVYLTRLDAFATPEPLGGVEEPPDLLVYSPSGGRCALYKQTSGLIRVVDDVRRSPWVSRRIPVADTEAEITALAIGDAGHVLFASAGGLSAVAPESETATAILSVRRVSAIAFAPASPALVFADAEEQTLSAIDNVEHPEPVLLAGAADGVNRPQGLLLTADTRKVFVTQNGDARVLIVQRDPVNVVSVECPCMPSGLERLSTPSVLRLTEETSGAVWILDSSREEPVIMFVAARGNA